jgi:hypothetical protein
MDKIEVGQPNCHFTINVGDAGDAAPSGQSCRRGVNKFLKTFATLASSSVFSLAKSENNWPKI